MCLDSDPEEVKRLLNYKRIDCYKIAYCFDGELNGCFQTHYKYKSGWNQSNSTDQLHNLRFSRIVKGIHVFLHKPELNDDNCYVYNNLNCLVSFCQYSMSISENILQKFTDKIYIPALDNHRRLIKCKAFISDLIGANKREAVFKKIYIPKVNYNA